MTFDVIAGVEAAGIPHSAALAFFLKQPSVFIRKQAKDHGLKKRVEGGDIKKKKVLLIEDHVTTSISSLDCINALKEEGGTADDCLAITTYGFAEADAAFVAAGVALHTLTKFSYILDVLVRGKELSPEDRRVIDEWFEDPHGWTERHQSQKKLD